MDADEAELTMKTWTTLLPRVAEHVDEAVLGIRLERVSRIHDTFLRIAIAAEGSTVVRNVGDFRFLALLRRSGPLTLTQASKRLQTTKAATSTRAERMVLTDVVKRLPSQSDRRSSSLSLAESATSFVDSLLERVVEAHVSFLGALSDDEVALLSRLLAKLHESHSSTRSAD